MDPILSLVPISASLEQYFSSDGAEWRAMHMTVRPARRESVRIANGGEVADAEWRLSVHPGDQRTTERHDAHIGLASYHEAIDDDEASMGESIDLWVNAPTQTFQSTLETLRAGRLPAVIQLAVRGLEYGWEPDGSGKVWDVVANKHLPITNIQIHTPLVAPAVAESEAGLNEWGEVDATQVPPSQADINRLEAALLAQQRTLKESGTVLHWILGVLVVLVAFLLFR